MVGCSSQGEAIQPPLESRGFLALFYQSVSPAAQALAGRFDSF
jgi:hypothetical protein